MEMAVMNNNSIVAKRVQAWWPAEEAEEEELKRQTDASSLFLLGDCVASMLIRLPIGSLQRSTQVCKLWHSIIRNPVFIRDYAFHSVPVILFQTSGFKEDVPLFSVEDPSLVPIRSFGRPLPNPWDKNVVEKRYYLQFMEFVGGKAIIRDYSIGCWGQILASCNGLILLENKLKKGGLIVINPVTRKWVFLRPGTLVPPEKESYGLVFDASTSQYKIVHLFHEEYIGCEIMLVETQSWRMVVGTVSSKSISWLCQKPVFAMAALHWLPSYYGSDCIVSLDIEKERFQTIALPKKGGRIDRLFEMGGNLHFSVHDENYHIGIWVLNSLSEGKWTKMHNITATFVLNMVPISGSVSGAHIVFLQETVEPISICVYDFNRKRVTVVAVLKDVHPVRCSYFSHVNSIVSVSS